MAEGVKARMVCLFGLGYLCLEFCVYVFVCVCPERGDARYQMRLFVSLCSPLCVHRKPLTTRVYPRQKEPEWPRERVGTSGKGQKEGGKAGRG